jgi:hypothetical protein
MAPLGQALRNQPREQIGRSAGREADNDFDRPRRIRLGEGSTGCAREKKKHQGDIFFHVFPPQPR